jgi:hypothetical protein
MLVPVKNSVFTGYQCRFGIQIINSIVFTTSECLVPPNPSRICELKLLLVIIGLQENIPDAMAFVDVTTIRKWGHRMIR